MFGTSLRVQLENMCTLVAHRLLVRRVLVAFDPFLFTDEVKFTTNWPRIMQKRLIHLPQRKGVKRVNTYLPWYDYSAPAWAVENPKAP